ncbi:hypothetical protein COW46_03545 [Candidatus Gracilibacteria bacterium CG17_big_fil_post_rev_8_21_14_2_50_48_13]|nr:MAG: hypothetical protein COW46_03545 [Candidatus Gracilibacteria bacterium CG17_big_fil_post_rev_8_21_14_2_50_48_13]
MEKPLYKPALQSHRTPQVQPAEQLRAELRGGALAAVQTEEKRQRILDLPDIAPEEEHLKEYLLWAKKTAILAADMKRAPGSSFTVYMHFKRGAIIYLDPLGVYLFPTSFYRRTSGPTRSDTPGFIVDASDIREAHAAKAFVENSVRLLRDSAYAPPIVVPDSTDRVDRLPMN